VLRALVHTGLRADILTGGEITRGSRVYMPESETGDLMSETREEGDE
jgi:hypothetical protein